MRCLVTGAAGFLGSWVVKRLVENGDTVTVLLRPSSDVRRIQALLPQVEVIRCDLADIETIRGRLKAICPEVVFHLAWVGGNSGRYQNTLTQMEDNLPVSLALLRAAAEAGARRWVGVGSAAEYGLWDRPLAETTVPQPHTLYAISKYALCLTSAKLCDLLGMDWVWVRPFAVYGPQDNPNGLIPFVVRSLLRGECPALTAGEQCWDYLYVEDAAEAMVRLASAPAPGIVNVASGSPITLRRLVEQIRNLIDPQLPLEFGKIAYPPDQLMNLQADTSKLRRLTGWAPKSLEEGLSRVITAIEGAP